MAGRWTFPDAVGVPLPPKGNPSVTRRLRTWSPLSVLLQLILLPRASAVPYTDQAHASLLECYSGNTAGGENFLLCFDLYFEEFPETPEPEAYYWDWALTSCRGGD